MKELKVLFVNRHNALSHRGGDTVQMLKTKEFLEKNYPVKIEIALNEAEFNQHKDADLVHIFNIQTIDETLKFVELCKANKMKFGVSTIYWDLSDSIFITFLTNTFGYMNFQESTQKYKDLVMNGKKMLGSLLNKKDQFGSRDYVEKRRKVLAEADLLLPNSHEEMEIMEKEFGLNNLSQKTVVVPNAVDYNPDAQTTKLSLEWLNDLENIVLEVGRIEPTKNQAGVIKGLMDHPEIPIVFVGRVQNERYADYVKSLAEKRGNVHFVDQIDHSEIFALYQKAAVHVLPSFRESPGLSSLEALFAGCNIVAASVEYCPVQYYQFDQYGEICNPYDPASIGEAILKSLQKGKVELPQEYYQDYSYTRVAELTYQAYQRLVE